MFGFFPISGRIFWFCFKSRVLPIKLSSKYGECRTALNNQRIFKKGEIQKKNFLKNPKKKKEENAKWKLANSSSREGKWSCQIAILNEQEGNMDMLIRQMQQQWREWCVCDLKKRKEIRDVNVYVWLANLTRVKCNNQPSMFRSSKDISRQQKSSSLPWTFHSPRISWWTHGNGALQLKSSVPP